MRTLLAVLLITGCRDAKSPGEDTAGDTITVTDADSDGYLSDEDCDDADKAVNPGATESCDGVDNDCDGVVDEDVTTTFYADADGDGFGDPIAVAEACEVPSGYVSSGNDCDDRDATAYPGAAERCDLVDNDCDGDIDEEVTTEWHADADGDSYGDADSVLADCDPPSGYVSDATDCDDLDSSAYPGAAEVCDEADNDCDDLTDEDVTTTYYVDADDDNYGLSDATTEACSRPTGYAARAGDCDDTDDDISPSATELCDEVDNDCDGSTDEDDAADAATWYADDDSDGYGDADDSTVACAAPSGTVASSTDCDDSTAEANPGEAEVCDDIDNDCDGETDEQSATDAATWYADSDGDGYGSSSSTVACEQPTGFADNSDDCDDAEADANPGESEVCDEIDNDCDGLVDEGLTTTYYADADGDGYGAASYTTEACTAPSGYVADDSDCDDASASASPGESEVCDEADNDCDGAIDEGVTATFYADRDGDSYGDVDSTTEACSAPSGYVSDDSDCDDLDGDISPDGEEVCDEVDNDCDGATDEGSADPETWYADADGDGYGDVDSTTEACDLPSGYTDDDTDCDDTDADISPGASESCSGEDDDCDGVIDDGVLGTGEDCAAESCAEVLDDDSTASDGDYYLDVAGDGTVEPYSCDMSTDGGGWTQVVAWDRITDGDGWSELDAEMDTVYDNMTRQLEGTSYLYWADWDSTADVLAYKRDVPFANDGEIIVDIYYYGYSMDNSAMFIYAETSSADEDILCREDDDGGYSSTEYSYWPYTCATSADTSWTWNSITQSSFSDEIEVFHFRSFMWDGGGGDYSYLYRLNVYIR